MRFRRRTLHRDALPIEPGVPDVLEAIGTNLRPSPDDDPLDEDADLRAILETLDPKARDILRRVLIHDQADRDATASELLRYRDERDDHGADIIDMLTLHPEARREVARSLAEIDAEK
jgi:hypothetical protein